MIDNLLRKKPYEARGKTFLIFLMFTLTLFSINSVSALNFDNVLDYQEDDMKVVFNNMFNLPIIGEELGTIELKSHSSVTETKGFGFGKEEVVMYYDFTNWELYKDGLGDVKFINMNTGKEVNKEYKFVEWKGIEVDVNDYEQVCDKDFINGTKGICNSILIGTHKETKYEWVEYKSKDIPARDVRIGLKTYVGQNDYVDGVWTIVGKEVTRHITWTGDINNSLVSYWRFDEAAGNPVDIMGNNTLAETDILHNQVGATANTGTSFNYSAGSNIVKNSTAFVGANVNLAGTMWVRADLVDAASHSLFEFSGANSYTSQLTLVTGEEMKFYNYDGSTYSSQLDYASYMNDWTFIYWEITSTTMKLYFNNEIKLDNASTWKGFGDGGALASFTIGNNLGLTRDFLGGIDEVGFWNRTLSEAEINYLWNDGDYCAYGDDDCGVSQPVATLLNPANYTNFTVNEVDFECYVNDTTNALTNVSLYINDVLNETITNPTNATSEWFNDTILSDGEYDWTCEVCSNISECFTAEEFILVIDTTNPEVAILAPSETIDSHVLDTNISLNWSANDSNLDMCWYGYEGVNYTVTCLDNTTSVNITNAENRTIYFWVNDTLGHITATSITWEYNFIETDSSYSSSAYETDNETFKINVTTTQTITSFSAVLNYNGTIYAADSSCSSGDCEIDATIDIPLLNTEQTTENKTFFWELTIFNSTGTSNINTSTNTQNITYVNMSSYISPSEAVNFTIYNESDLTDLSADISASFNYYLGGGSVTKTANYSGTSNTFSIYITPNESFITNPQIDLSATGYDSRRYDFLNEVYTNVTTNKSLYLSNSTFASDIIVEVRDEGLTPMSGVRVNISRYYPEIGIWNEVASQVTDNFGQFVEKLIQNDVKYKFQFWDADGTLLKTSDDIRIICRATICVLPFVIEGTTEAFEDFEDVALFTSDLTYDNTTNLFTFSWNDQTGESIIMRLNVQRYLLNSSTQVCNTTSTSSLSTLSCDVGDSVATYKAQAYRRISGEREIRIAILNIKANDPYATYGVEGLFWTFILLFTCAGIGAFNPSVGVALYGTGFIVMGILGIISMPLQVFFANTLICAIFIWSMKT